MTVAVEPREPVVGGAGARGGTGLPSKRLLVVSVGVVAAGAWLAFLYAHSWHTSHGTNSDNANAVLAGRDLTANPFLPEWILPGDPYWSVDLPLYGVFTAVAGVGETAMHAVPAAIGAVLIGLAAWMAGAVVPGGRNRWIGSATVLVILGLPFSFLSSFLLLGPQHVATTLMCLASFALLGTRPGRLRWWLGVAILTAAVLGDPLALAFGAVPVAAAGLLAAFRNRHWAPLLPAVAAGGIATVGWALGGAVLRHFGAFALAPPLPLSPPWNRGNNLRLMPRILGALLGVSPEGGLTGVGRAGHAVGAVAVLAAVAVTALLLAVGVARGSRSPRGSEGVSLKTGPGGVPLKTDDRPPRPWRPDPTAWLDDVLLLGFFGGLAAYVLITLPPGDVLSARYLTPSLVYGVILAGRRVAAASGRHRGFRMASAATVVAMGCVYLATSVSAMHGQGTPRPGHELASWLAARGLQDGFAPYWLASIVTVESGGSVRVRPVRGSGGQIHGDSYYASRSWFEPDGRRPARFLVTDTVHFPAVNDDSARATFGPPDQVESVGPLRILIWDEDIRPRLTPPLLVEG